jgi:hypothetical protein
MILIARRWHLGAAFTRLASRFPDAVQRETLRR